MSVHAPLDANTEGLMNAGAFAEMKKSAIFLNLGRGPIVVEKDLAEALKSGTIAAAGLDVLSAEPMRADNPLREIKDSDKLMITPHIAWASIEARTRLMKIIEGADPGIFPSVKECAHLGAHQLGIRASRPLWKDRLPYSFRNSRVSCFLQLTFWSVCSNV